MQGDHSKVVPGNCPSRSSILCAVGFSTSELQFPVDDFAQQITRTYADSGLARTRQLSCQVQSGTSNFLFGELCCSTGIICCDRGKCATKAVDHLCGAVLIHSLALWSGERRKGTRKSGVVSTTLPARNSTPILCSRVARHVLLALSFTTCHSHAGTHFKSFGIVRYE